MENTASRSEIALYIKSYPYLHKSTAITDTPSTHLPIRALSHWSTLYAASLASTAAMWPSVVFAVVTDAVSLTVTRSESPISVVVGIPGQVLKETKQINNKKHIQRRESWNRREQPGALHSKQNSYFLRENTHTVSHRFAYGKVRNRSKKNNQTILTTGAKKKKPNEDSAWCQPREEKWNAVVSSMIQYYLLPRSTNCSAPWVCRGRPACLWWINMDGFSFSVAVSGRWYKRRSGGTKQKQSCCCCCFQAIPNRKWWATITK